MVFVFGSNEDGIHGAGAAAFAMQKHGAIWKKGHGRHGNSYALPTKDKNIVSLQPEAVREYVEIFKEYTKKHPKEEFQVTAIGTGLAGFSHPQIATMFADAPSNCLFDEVWRPYLGDDKRYWGTFTTT